MPTTLIKKIHAVAFHHNGVAGEGFHVVHFTSERRKLLGVVFEDRGCVAVLNPALAAYGLGDPYRGDLFESELRAAVTEYEAKRAAV